MLRTLVFSMLFIALAAPLASAGDGGRWLHISVDERHDNERVRVNLPLDLVEAVLPLIEADDFHRGRVRVDLDEIHEVDLPAILAAVRDAEDGEYVTVDSDDEKVRVAKEAGHLVIRAHDRHEEVDIRIRLEVVDALLSGGPDELDLVAAVQALGSTAEGVELVSVEGDDEQVRIWIDSKSTAD